MGIGRKGRRSADPTALERRRPSSVARALQVIGADPEGSVLSGDTARPYLTEGVGEDFFPGTFDPTLVDRWVRVSDRDSFAAARRLTREEGILAGGSCGTALVAMLSEARRVMAEDPDGAPGKVMVVLLPDSGRSYLSKIYNDEWLRANGLLASRGAIVRVADLVADRHHEADRPSLVLARTTERVGAAIETLQAYGISQMPVSEAADGDAIESIVGAISEKGLLDRAYRDASVVERTVGEVMDRPLPMIEMGASLDEAFSLLSAVAAATALLAVRDGRPAGVITRLDLLEYLAHHPA
jgi:cystathionine beta-synthase